MRAAQASIRINAMSHSEGKVIWITFATWQPFRLSLKRFKGIFTCGHLGQDINFLSNFLRPLTYRFL